MHFSVVLLFCKWGKYLSIEIVIISGISQQFYQWLHFPIGVFVSSLKLTFLRVHGKRLGRPWKLLGVREEEECWKELAILGVGFYLIPHK